MASVPSDSTVATPVRLCESVSVPAPVFSSGPATGTEIEAETPEATVTDGTVRAAVPVTVAFARNSTLAAVTAESTVAASPAFSKTAAVESYQSPATPFFDHLPPARQLAPESPSFHTYSPTRVSAMTTFAPLSARTRL